MKKGDEERFCIPQTETDDELLLTFISEAIDKSLKIDLHMSDFVCLGRFMLGLHI